METIIALNEKELIFEVEELVDKKFVDVSNSFPIKVSLFSLYLAFLEHF